MQLWLPTYGRAHKPCDLSGANRDELLTNCKESTGVSTTAWCFTVVNNKRRACTDAVGATRPLSWFLAQKQVPLLSAVTPRSRHPSSEPSK
jgi:hypothetical protein